MRSRTKSIAALAAISSAALSFKP